MNTGPVLAAAPAQFGTLVMVQLPITPMQPWFRTIRDLTAPFRWSDLFEKPAPVELDIGAGRGLFTLNAALTHPDRNILAVEIDYREGRRAAERLKKRDLANARVIGGDVMVLLADVIPENSVDATHVYFPDPWWKPRHHKRRLFDTRFCDLLARVLKPGGQVHHWTDVADYFQMVTAAMDSHSEFSRSSAPEEREPEHDMDYQTSFERKKRKMGFPIYRALWQRH